MFSNRHKWITHYNHYNTSLKARTIRTQVSLRVKGYDEVAQGCTTSFMRGHLGQCFMTGILRAYPNPKVSMGFDFFPTTTTTTTIIIIINPWPPRWKGPEPYFSVSWIEECTFLHETWPSGQQHPTSTSGNGARWGSPGEPGLITQMNPKSAASASLLKMKSQHLACGTASNILLWSPKKG